MLQEDAMNMHIYHLRIFQQCYFFVLEDHMPDKEPRKRKPKKTFEMDFNDDVNFDAYFRATRVKPFVFISITQLAWEAVHCNFDVCTFSCV